MEVTDRVNQRFVRTLGQSDTLDTFSEKCAYTHKCAQHLSKTTYVFGAVVVVHFVIGQSCTPTNFVICSLIALSQHPGATTVKTCKCNPVFQETKLTLSGGSQRFSVHARSFCCLRKHLFCLSNPRRKGRDK